MKLHDHVTGTDVEIRDLTDEALHVHLRRTADPSYDSLRVIPVYAEREAALAAEAARRVR
jgi:hypothetical protein